MDGIVFAVVLVAALLHATWNGFVKNHNDKTATVLSLWFLTKPFHVACSNAATKTTANTIPSML